MSIMRYVKSQLLSVLVVYIHINTNKNRLMRVNAFTRIDLMGISSNSRHLHERGRVCALEERRTKLNKSRTNSPLSSFPSIPSSLSYSLGATSNYRLGRRLNISQNPIALFSSSSSTGEGIEAEEELDIFLSDNNLREATRVLQTKGANIALTKDRIIDIFRVIELRTTEAEENNTVNKRALNEQQITPGPDYEFTPLSPARTEMTDMYRTLQSTQNLRIFGAASIPQTLPILGSKTVPVTLLEKITDLPLSSLSPKPTNTLLYTGIALAIIEEIISLSTGINLNFLFAMTGLSLFLDNLVLSGACLETIYRTLIPSYSNKVLRHEAGHFLIAYLLGCPVEGVVLSPWAALADARFGSRTNSAVSAGTSFFDPELSSDINVKGIVRRGSIDRFSIIVMGGIAAEAIEFGSADGGAGDEAALVGFLRSLNPKIGARVWDEERVKNQARWGVMQAVVLLREYQDCYKALVKALENGGGLGECVYAIESALDDREGSIGKCVGSITEIGGMLTYMAGLNVLEPTERVANSNGETPSEGNSRATFPLRFENTSTTSKSPEPTQSATTLEEDASSLRSLKEQMVQKLKNIDDELENLTSQNDR